jgi:hypothetical protein
MTHIRVQHVWTLAAAVFLLSACGDDTGQSAADRSIASAGTVGPSTATNRATASGHAPVPDQGVFGLITVAGGKRGISGAMIQPVPGPGNQAPEREVFATTAADGSYGVALSPGNWTLTISADGYQPGYVRLVVPSHGTTQVDLTLAPA